jgi:UDP-N-acetyl-D-mannosaminuronate dehydrogenase
LLAEGVQLEVHDPSVETLPESWPGSVIRRSTPLEVLAKADALVVATEWPQYKDIQPHHLENIKPGLVVIDANRFLQHLNVDGVDYVAVGTPQGAS